MSEPTNLKYDPDDFDPIVVKDRKSIWSLIVPVVCMTGVTIFFFKSMFLGAVTRAYMPGNWVGSIGMMDGFNNVVVVGVLLVSSLAWALLSKRIFLAIGLALWFWGVTYVGTSSAVRNPPSVRINSEMPNYKEAIRTKVPFGDQHTEESLGRNLTYWRWIQYGLDDAVGVIYDPEDRLGNTQTPDSMAGDSMAFHDLTHGALYRIQKIEPHWYFVKHS